MLQSCPVSSSPSVPPYHPHTSIPGLIPASADTLFGHNMSRITIASSTLDEQEASLTLLIDEEEASICRHCHYVRSTVKNNRRFDRRGEIMTPDVKSRLHLSDDLCELSADQMFSCRRCLHEIEDIKKERDELTRRERLMQERMKKFPSEFPESV